MKSLKKALGIGKEKAPLVTEGAEVKIDVQSGILTNLRSKNAGFSTDALYQLLSDLSVGDARHDFEFKVGDDLNNANFKAAFCYGIPEEYQRTLDESQCLNSVIQSYSIDNEPEIVNDPPSYAPIEVAKKNGVGIFKAKHHVTTVNGNKYQVNYTDVKQSTRPAPEKPPVKKSMIGKITTAAKNLLKGNKVISESIDAPTFYEDLELDTTKNIAIVVDAASIGLYDILNKGTFAEEVRPVVYYMFGEEVVNDPATKKSPDAKEFQKTDGVGVKFTPCVPKEINKNQYYNYYYENPHENTPFIKQFYTNYEFHLSQLKETVKGRSLEYITNLNIFGKATGELNLLPNSKSKNDITFIKSFIQGFINKLFGRSVITNEQRFLFSSALQQKRSGDWLQVLLCAAIKDHLRQFVDISSGQDVNDFDRVFLVTHDQIALAFALLMGIDCIFTHCNNTLGYYSAFVYKIIDPEADNDRKSALAEKIVSDYKDKLKTKINELIKNINVYQQNNYDMLTNRKINILNDQRLRVELEKMKYDSTGEYTYTITNKDNNKYNVTWFNIETRAIFTAALEAMIGKNIIPNLNDQIVVLTYIITGIDETLHNDRLSNIDLVIQNYNTYNTQYENIKKIYEKANSVDNVLFDSKITDFKKSNIYKRAAEWTWDINISSREVAFMENDATSTYKSDRNIFLYNLNEIDDIFKQKITFIYYKYYTFLLDRCTLTTTQNLNDNFKNGDGPISERSYIKFRAVALSFCTEVLLTLGGGFGVNFDKTVQQPVTLTHKAIVDTMEGFLDKNPETISTLLKDDVVVQEDTNYNNAVEKCIVDSLDQEVAVVNNENTPVSDEAELFFQLGPSGEHIGMNGGGIITVGSFMTSTKQVTYPLLTLIMNNSNYYDRVKDYLLSQKVDIVDEAILPSESYRSLTPDNAATVIQRAVRDKITSTSNINKNVSDFYAPSFTKIEPPMVAPSEKTLPYNPPGATTRSKKLTTPDNTEEEEEENTGGQSVAEEKLRNKKGQYGGSIQNLRSLFASLPKSSSETPITFYNTTDIFQDNTICFHPLLPIYMITQTYMSAINNEHIEESLDFDLFVNYLNFLKKIKEKVVEIYSGENNTNINKLEAYAIGLGLKQLLFVSNNTNEGYRDCVKVLNADDNIYRSVSSLTDVLCSAICGKITHADIVLLEGPIYLNSDLFTQFARSLNVNRIFGFYVDTTNFDLSNFKAQVLEFSNELAQQIIADRNGRSTVPISPASSISAPIRSSDNVASGLKPFDPSRVKTAKDIGFTYSSDRDLENTMKPTSSSGSISQGKGGKKSRKHKEKVKRQTRKHKKQAKNIKHKTRKHKKYAKKTRRSTSV